MAKLTLELEEDFSFKLIGINCHVKDYRLCWEVNEALHFDFVKEKDYEVIAKGVAQYYSFYSFIDEDNYTEYYLISNRGDSGRLIPEEKCDFLLLIKGNIRTEQLNEISEKLHKIKNILTAYPIEVEQLKSRKNLIF